MQLELLNEQGQAVKGARALVLGLSYKADIDDDRESPSYELIELLQDQPVGAGHAAWPVHILDA